VDVSVTVTSQSMKTAIYIFTRSLVACFKSKKMKRGKLIILLLVCIFSRSYGQKIELTNTKDLLSISKSEGLFSALNKIEEYPIYYIDRSTTNELLKQTLRQPYSDEIESYLLNLTLDDRLPELANPLNHLIKLKSQKALETATDDYDKIDKNEMYSIVINHNQYTEHYLIQYYKTWLSLAKKNRDNYTSGKAVLLKSKDALLDIPTSKRVFHLMKPYKTCNYNCYMIMLALKKMGSKVADTGKIYYHKKVGKAYDVNMSIFKHEKGNTFLKKTTPKTIKLTKRYATIKDIDFAHEMNFTSKYLKELNPDYGIYGFYNRKSGFISIWQNDKCSYYLIKLVDEKKLKIYETNLYSVITD
jgi:hypothetical protein